MIIDPPAYFADSTNSINIIEPSTYHINYLLGILNSTLFQWRFKLTSTNNNVATNELESMPMRTIDFSNPTEKALHNKLVELVDRMLDLNMKLPDAEMADEIKDTDNQIDRIVYDLYDLTKKDIKIVEGKN